MTAIYNERGIKQRVDCPCPQCREPITKVLRSGVEDGGEVVRQRQCPKCGNRWFTAQEPEYIVRAEAIHWPRDKPVLRRQTFSKLSTENA